MDHDKIKMVQIDVGTQGMDRRVVSLAAALDLVRSGEAAPNAISYLRKGEAIYTRDLFNATPDEWPRSADDRKAIQDEGWAAWRRVNGPAAACRRDAENARGIYPEHAEALDRQADRIEAREQ